MDIRCTVDACAANHEFAAPARRALSPAIRRILAVLGLGIGFWLLTCLLHAAPASAQTTQSQPTPKTHQHVTVLDAAIAGTDRTVDHLDHTVASATHTVHRSLHTVSHQVRRATARVSSGVRAATQAVTQPLRTHTRHTVGGTVGTVTGVLPLPTGATAISAPSTAVVASSARSDRLTAGRAASDTPATGGPTLAAGYRAATRSPAVAGHTGSTSGVTTTPTAPSTPSVPPVPSTPAAPSAPGTARTSIDRFAATLPTAAGAATLVLRAPAHWVQAPVLGIAASEPTFSPD